MKPLMVFFLTTHLFFSTICSRSFTNERNYIFDVALVAIFQDESRFLKEWIEFHKLVGVQHFYLYNNNSTDNYQEVLSEYVKSGLVDLIEWPSENNSWKNFCYKIQPGAYWDAVQRALGVARWLVIIDTDEFLFPVQEWTISSCLKRHFKSAVGVYVNWQLYGTSGVYAVAENELMIEKLVMKAPTNYPRNSNCKTIVRPEYVSRCTNPHYIEYKRGYGHVLANGASPKKSMPGIYIDKIRINHYWTRDENFFYNQKIPRYQTFNHGDYNKIKANFENENRTLNQVYDDAVFRFVPELKRILRLNKTFHN